MKKSELPGIVISPKKNVVSPGCGEDGPYLGQDGPSPFCPRLVHDSQVLPSMLRPTMLMNISIVMQ